MRGWWSCRCDNYAGYGASPCGTCVPSRLKRCGMGERYLRRWGGNYRDRLSPYISTIGCKQALPRDWRLAPSPKRGPPRQIRAVIAGGASGRRATSAIVELVMRRQYTDPETGLLYLRARYYDPATAQFLTRDPLDASTRSAYSYGGNDPLNMDDPSGLGFGWHSITHAAGSAVNNVLSATTGGRANCVRDVTCSASTKSAFVSSQNAADFAGGVLNGVTGGNAKNLLGLAGSQGKANLDSTWGWSGQATGALAMLATIYSANPGIGAALSRTYSVANTMGTCTSGAAIGFCVVSGLLSIGAVATTFAPWETLGRSSEALVSTIFNYLGFWPSFMADRARAGACNG